MNDTLMSDLPDNVIPVGERCPDCQSTLRLTAVSGDPVLVCPSSREVVRQPTQSEVMRRSTGVRAKFVVGNVMGDLVDA